MMQCRNLCENKYSNYFVEGIQGSGKTTMVAKLSKEYPDYKVYREGDYSPVELAWCALVNESQYSMIKEKYSAIADEIADKTVTEGDKKIILYTQIITDISGFHKELEQYEIYNGNKNRQEFEEIVLNRFAAWNGNGEIFECSLFQNIIENMILFFEMSDDSIVSFYKKLKTTLLGKEYEIIYLDVDNIRKTEEVIKKERSDEKGVELWFPLMLSYLEKSPYGVNHDLKGMDGLVEHLTHRVKLEKRILSEVFTDHYRIVQRSLI